MKRPFVGNHPFAALALALALLGVGWADAKPKGPTPDSKLGLLDAPAGAQKDLPAPQTEGSTPGQNDKLQRSYSDAPPMIPHAVDEYLPITTRNECINCHVNPPKAMIEAHISVVPDSHYVGRETSVAGAPPASVRSVDRRFYQCSMCHAAQTDAPTLKGNTFRP